MSEVNTTVNSADSSAAGEQNFDVRTLSGEQRTEWRKTGKWPEQSASAPEKKPEVKSAAPPDEKQPSAKAETAPDSELEEESQEPYKPRTANRIKELLADRKQRDERIRELEARVSPAKEVQAPPAQTEANAKPKPNDVDTNGKPKYGTWEEYEDARDAWVQNDTLIKFQAHQQQSEQQKALSAKVTEGRERYQDFDTVVIPAVNSISNNPRIASQVKEALNRAENLVDVLYVLGEPKALADFTRTAETDPVGAIIKLAVIGIEVKKELAKGTTDETKPPVPVKKVSQAPRPPEEVGSGSAPVPDAEEQAVSSDNFSQFKAARNRRDLAAAKRG